MFAPNTVGPMASIIGSPKKGMEANPIMAGPSHEFSGAPYSMAKNGMEPSAGIGGTTRKFGDPRVIV